MSEFEDKREVVFGGVDVGNNCVLISTSFLSTMSPVGMHASSTYFIYLAHKHDAGGSHVGVCLVNKLYAIVASVEESNTIEEISDSGVMIEKIFRLLEQLQVQYGEVASARLAAVGIGCPGQPKDGVLMAAANFPMWKQVPFVDIISSTLNIPATLLNGKTVLN